MGVGSFYMGAVNHCVILYVYIYHVCPVSILHVANCSSSVLVTNDALCSLYEV